MSTNPMEYLLQMQRQVEQVVHAAANDDQVTLSYALTVTDGEKPGAGTIVTVKTGRYAHDEDVTDPDEQEAYRERTLMRDTIREHLVESNLTRNLLPDGRDALAEGLTDDIVAALAGE